MGVVPTGQSTPKIETNCVYSVPSGKSVSGKSPGKSVGGEGGGGSQWVMGCLILVQYAWPAGGASFEPSMPMAERV